MISGELNREIRVWETQSRNYISICIGAVTGDTPVWKRSIAKNTYNRDAKKSATTPPLPANRLNNPNDCKQHYK